MATNQTLNTNSIIVEDWYGGYKLELDITSKSNIDNWELDFTLPYEISAAYGVDLVKNSNGNYTIKGQSGWANLNQNQTIRPIFIIEDYGNQALPLEFTHSAPISTPEVSYHDPIANEPEPTSNLERNAAVETNNSNSSGVISVDHDFNGNLERAIAAANDGEIVQLGSNTYYTSGITINQDITIQGQAGSIVNGGGTSQAIFSLTAEASGTTIQNLEITNANNGIYGHSAANVTLKNLDIHHIGNTQRISEGQNNTGITLNHAPGLQILDSNIYNIGRKGVSVGDTDGAMISGLTIKNVNLEAKHSQSHDAAGIKFFNTNDVLLKNSYFSDINANYIWNDTTNRTTIEYNTIEDVGEDFLKPYFDQNVNISGIYNEKSSNSIVRHNSGSAIPGFSVLNATKFTTETMTLNNNDFSSFELDTRDYWVNESAERLIALEEDPYQADFSLFANEYYEQANIA